MSTIFLALPAPAANGAGVAVDVSTMGATKSIVVEGNGSDTEPFVVIEIANDAAGVKWTSLVMFWKPGEKTVAVACRWMRARVTNYQGGGAPMVSVGGEDDGTSFATLVAPANNGNGAGVDVSLLPAYKTIQVKGAFEGCLNIEISNDGGVKYSLLASFQPNRNGLWSGVVVADFMRINRSGIPAGASPGLPVINVGASSQAGGGATGISIENAGVPLAGGPFDTLNLLGTLSAINGGGGTADVTGVAGASGGDRTWYGTGVDGPLVVATGTVFRLGDDTGLNPAAFPCFTDITVQTGASIYTNGFPIYCSGTLTIEGTGTVEASGMNGGLAGAGGAGGNTGTGGTTKSGYVVAPGTVWANGNPGANGGGAGGNGGSGQGIRSIDGNAGGAGGGAGGAGGVNASNGVSCFANPFIAMAVDMGDPFNSLPGGGSGGGGGEGIVEPNIGGGAGGGGGVLRINARAIVCPDGAIKSTGGNGRNGAGTGGGGGGGSGGVILLITDGPFAPAAKCDVTGGLGGAGTAGAGAAGDAGFVVAISPVSGPL